MKNDMSPNSVPLFVGMETTDEGGEMDKGYMDWLRKGLKCLHTTTYTGTRNLYKS